MPTSPALFAPWRMDYIRSLGGQRTEDATCFLCEAAAAGDGADPGAVSARRDRLVLWHSEHATVLLNRYPYANGHLLVAPRRHAADLEELTPAELADVGAQTVEAVRLLKSAVSAQGFNVGINLGRIAGAGVPGHLHQHVVPRWGGDTNFMHVVGQVSVVPETTLRLWEELVRVRDAEIVRARRLRRVPVAIVAIVRCRHLRLRKPGPVGVRSRKRRRCDSTCRHGFGVRRRPGSWAYLRRRLG